MPAEAWRDLAEMGWLGLGLSERAGGLGLSAIEEALVLREFGRVLAPPSALATVLALHLARPGDGDLTRGLMTGAVRAGFALPTGENPCSLEDGFLLVDAEGADLIVVWTPTAGWLFDRAAFRDLQVERAFDDSLLVLRSEWLDRGQPRAHDEGREFQQRARLLSAAMLVGGLEATRDLTAGYARLRQQFGRAIGAFQAVSHPCAEMAVDAEAAAAILQYAAVCLRDGSEEAEMYCAAAKVVAGRSAQRAAMAAMQIFGGYGQTYDSLPHFYLKRAHIYQALGGGLRAVARPVIGAATTL